MTERERTEAEIATIRKRDIEICLSDADVMRLWDKAGEAGLTAGELITSFIGDLVGGTYSNGSDERMYANNWFERCGFSYTAEKTLLCYLLTCDDVNSFLYIYDEMAVSKELLVELEAQEEKDADELDEIEGLKEDIAYQQENIDEVFTGFTIWCNGEHKGIDEEMKELLEWRKSRERALGAN